MHTFEAKRRTILGPLLGAALAVGLLAPGAASASSPAQVSPKRGTVFAAGSQPVFKVRDGSRAARRYSMYITISTSKKRKRNGDLRRTEIGTFASMKRRRSIHSYKPENYTFPTWFMVRPGTYYWQTYRIDCRASRS